MAKSLTSRTGFFMLQGKASDDDGHIDPILTFDHECIVNKKPRMLCHLRTRVRLHPHLYVDKGLVDIGIFEIADYPAATQETCSWMRWFLPD
ncbi:hypothetical protein WR25_03189 isoform B [Diploscapter pachys]|nr:hypothetical protein WR25_03189 isoform B [Diploscapter pachys]